MNPSTAQFSGTVIDSLEFETTDCFTPRAVIVSHSGTNYIIGITYREEDGTEDGVLVTFTVEGGAAEGDLGIPHNISGLPSGKIGRINGLPSEKVNTVNGKK